MKERKEVLCENPTSHEDRQAVLECLIGYAKGSEEIDLDSTRKERLEKQCRR